MSVIDGLLHRLHVLVRGEAYADEIRREIRFHRELDELSKNGNTVGNETYYREEVRRMTLTIWLDRARQDAAYAVRGLRRSRGFTVGVVLTLALGVGVNGAMFAILDRIFVQPPAGVAHPEQIRRLYFEFVNGTGGDKVRIQQTNYPQYRAFRDALGSAAPIAGRFGNDSVDVRIGETRVPAQTTYILGDYFNLLGAGIAAGRNFVGAEQEVATRTPVAILSDAFWRRAFNADRSALGRTVNIGTTAYTIVGIAAPEFRDIDLDATDLWTPYNMYGDTPNWYDTYQSPLEVVARPTGSADEARILGQGTNALRAVHVKYWVYDPNIRALAGPIVEARGPGRRGDDLVVATRVGGVAVIVLLITVANVLNLFLLRATRRRREIAVRRALGVSPARLTAQLTTESLVLALAAGAVATLFSAWAAVVIRRFLFPGIHWGTSAIDPRVVAFVFLVSVAIGFICGLAPAMHAMKIELVGSLKNAAHGGRAGSSTRGALLAAQTALCVALLVGAGLFIRSFRNVEDIGVGYRQDGALFLRPSFDDPAGHTAELKTALPDVVSRLREVPGVEAASYSVFLPLGGTTWTKVFIGGDSVRGTSADDQPSLVRVSGGFFAATGLDLKAGRDFTEADQTAATPPVAISETMARRFWGDRSPIGQCLVFETRDGGCAPVIAVVANARRWRIIEPPSMQIYQAISLRPVTGKPASFTSPRFIILRVTQGKAATVTRAAEQMLRSRVSGLLALRPLTFHGMLEPQLRPWRLGAALFSALGLLAIVVAAVGVYAVIGYDLSQRTHEMGVRLALGARPKEILDVVLRTGLRFVLLGIMLGLGVAMLLSRFIASQLFGVVPNDPGTLVGAATALLVVGAAACLAPGLRAARIDPAAALRSE